MDQVTVHVEVIVNPTESEEKVKKAVWNLFGDISMLAKPVQDGNALTGQAVGLENLATLRNVLKRDHIRDAARRVLQRSLRDDKFIFYLNKQVAFAGHVSFCEPEAESPLGPIKVMVQAENPPVLIDWLAPQTSRE